MDAIISWLTGIGITICGGYFIYYVYSILNAMPVQTVSLSESLSNNIAGGIFTAIACLVVLIT